MTAKHNTNGPCPKVGFIGAGNMTTSLLGGMLDNGRPAETLRASDHNPEKCERFAEKFGVHADDDNEALIAWADIVVLAVKPQTLQKVVRALAPALKERNPLVISIAAGVRCGDIQTWAGCPLALIRVMPNTPALVKTGMSVLFAAPGTTKEQRHSAENIQSAVGETLWVETEKELDCITALSGSGPAYFFLFMEALQEAGEALGIAPEKARKLTLQTALGASRMAHASEEDPATLRARVSSPGGTTERGLAALENGGLRNLARQAVADAAHRATELADLLSKES